MSPGATSIFRNIFKGVDEEALQILREFGQLRTYPPQTILCLQGRVEHTFYVIVEGRVAIIQRTEDGQDRLLAVHGPGGYFGELGLLDDTPRMANCVTVTEVKVIEITEDVFNSVLASSPGVAYALIRHVMDIMRDNDRLAIEDLRAKNVELEKAYAELKAAQAELVEKERLERELEIAASVQRSLLPVQLPRYDDYRLAAYLMPARRVGGDLYDALAVDEDHVGLVLADVADKSVQAALFMAVARTLFLVESWHNTDPAAVAVNVHQGVLKVAPSADIFITAFYGVLHRPSGTLRYVVAGHERPLLVRPGKSVEKLPGEGRFLGMLPDLELQEYSVQLSEGDRLFVYSDGVVDAMNGSGSRYGYERLVRFLDETRDVALNEAVERLTADIATWRGKAPAFDDLTILAIEAMGRNG
jgi:phosphoserine phosphatase RsbU/P